MTPERMADLVARWVRRYTRDLPAPIAERRIGEIDADLHDHIAHERAHGTAERRIALRVAARMLRGLPADAAWRGRALARTTTPKDVKPLSATVTRSVVRVAVVTTLVLLIHAVGMLVGDEMNWSAFDFVFAAVLLMGTGLLIEAAVRNPRNVAARVVAVVVAVAAIALGEADDAPGLVLFGCVVILGTLALTLRTAQRSGEDGA